MSDSDFMPEVKEREANQPCFVILNTYQPIGLGNKQIIFSMPNGTSLADAQNFARLLKESGVTVKIA